MDDRSVGLSQVLITVGFFDRPHAFEHHLVLVQDVEMSTPEAEPVKASPDKALTARHLAEAGKVDQRFVVVAGQKETENAQIGPGTRARGERNVQPNMRQGTEVHVDPVEVRTGLILTGDLKAVVVIGDEDSIVCDASVEGYRTGVQEGGVHEIDQVLEA